MQTRSGLAWRTGQFLGFACLLLATACGNDTQMDGSSVPVDLTTSNPVDLAGCHADRDCPRDSRCDVATASCVDCLADGDCPDGSRCVDHACVTGCSRAHGCGDAGVCEPDAGVCLECRQDLDCHDPKRRHCDVRGGGRCQPCLPSNDDCEPGWYCAQAAGDYGCVPGCRRDADCIALGDGGVNAVHCLPDTHQCVACLADGHCPPGAICAANTCVPGCNAQHACDGGKSCCNGACVDPMVDVANCGMCGAACNQGAAPTCCGGGCADIAADPINCGACGAAC